MTLLLHNARIVDVAAGRYHSPGTCLLIRDGRIAALPPSPVPADETHDLGGAAVVPGLFNAHCHVRLVAPALAPTLRDLLLVRRLKGEQVRKNLADCLAHGVTSVRDGWSANLGAAERLRERVRSGEYPGPRITRSVLVGPLGGTLTPARGPLFRLLAPLAGYEVPAYDDPAAGEVVFRHDAGPAEVREAVDRAIGERGAEAIKLYDQREKMLSYAPGAAFMTQAQLDAAADRAREKGVPSLMHQCTVETFRRGVRAGVRTLVHVPADGPLADADADAFVRAGCVIEPTLSLAYDLDFAIPGIPCADPDRLSRLARLRDATARDVATRFWLPDLAARVVAGADRLAAGRTRALGLIDTRGALRFFSGVVSHGMDNLNRLFAAGATVACGNDAGAVARTPGMVGLELALLGFCRAEAGAAWTGADALRCATIASARSLGVEDRLGSIEVGKIADLAVLRGDPIADPSLVGAPVEAVLVGGRFAPSARPTPPLHCLCRVRPVTAPGARPRPSARPRARPRRSRRRPRPRPARAADTPGSARS